MQREEENMKLEDFAKCVRSVINEHFCGSEVLVVRKNNGLFLTGICIPVSDKVSPIFYLDDIYKQMERHSSVEAAQVADGIVQEAHVLKIPEYINSKVADWEDAKWKLFPKLVNRKRNEELLTSVPWVPFLDLAVVFVVAVDGMNATCTVKNELANLWDVSNEELYAVAKENLGSVLCPEFYPLQSLLNELSPEIDIPVEEELPMYVLTGREKQFGASCILDEQVMIQIATQLDDDLVIIPSSINEVLILPASGLSRDELIPVICEVNSNCVAADEILSDRAYVYHRDTRKIE